MANNKKSKKISITAFDKIMREENTPIEIIEWHGIDVTIRKTLSLKDALIFVDTVSKSCFDSETGAYMPEVKVFAMKCCILEMYANFSLPANVEHKYDLVYNTDAVDTVLKHINMRQLNELTDAISEKVDNMAQANIENINKQMNDVYNAFNELQNHFGQILSGVNAEDVSKLVQSIAEGKIDEDKIVQAYLSQNKSEQGE